MQRPRPLLLTACNNPYRHHLTSVDFSEGELSILHSLRACCPNRFGTAGARLCEPQQVQHSENPRNLPALFPPPTLLRVQTRAPSIWATRPWAKEDATPQFSTAKFLQAHQYRLLQ